jgi:hypothetical protein
MDNFLIVTDVFGGEEKYEIGNAFKGEIVVGNIKAKSENDAINSFTKSNSFQDIVLNYKIDKNDLRAVKLYNPHREMIYLASDLTLDCDYYSVQLIIGAYMAFEDFDILTDSDEKLKFLDFTEMFDDFCKREIMDYLSTNITEENEMKYVLELEDVLDHIYVGNDTSSFGKIVEFPEGYKETSETYSEFYKHANDEELEEYVMPIYNAFKKEYRNVK